MIVNKQKSKYFICNNCVMDTSDPDITFNEEGVCSWCQTYEERRRMFVPSPEERENVIKNIDGCTRKKVGLKVEYVYVLFINKINIKNE